jgi:outer membrane protein
MINTQPASLARLGPALTLTAPEPNDIEAWNRIGQERSPLIVLYAQALKVAEEEVTRQRGANYPTLDFVATHGYSKSTNVYMPTPSTNESHTSQIGLQLNVPIFGGGATFSRTREAEARREQARATLEQTRRTTTRQTREAFLAVTTGMTRVQALEQARISGKRALESTLIGYESGVRTGVDVLNSQQALYRTERDLSQARYAYLINHLRLKLVTGILSPDDLAAVNALLTDS